MSKLVPCIHKGGESCKRQGGSGDLTHSAGYVHPIPTLKELGQPAGDPVFIKKANTEIHSLSILEDFFDEDFSKAVLNVSMDNMIHAVDVVKKSLYDFDLESTDGVIKLLELLPVIDREILGDIAGEIWPGYPSEDNNPDLLRLEIKGYLMDYLDGHGIREAQTAPEDLAGETDGAEGQSEDSDGEGAGGGDETSEPDDSADPSVQTTDETEDTPTDGSNTEESVDE